MPEVPTTLAIDLSTLEFDEITFAPAVAGGGLEMLNASNGMTELAASCAFVASCCCSPACCCCCI
ncbi:hypothetical protein WEH80_18470 [Actinomycetes bacterium KLBMP 9759]